MSESAPTGDYFFVRRPIVAIVISIVTVLVGVVAMGRLPIAQYPDIVPPEIQVTATYTGADAITIEQAVATPIEQQVNGVDYMLYLRSVNANDGTMTLRVSFDVDKIGRKRNRQPCGVVEFAVDDRRRLDSKARHRPGCDGRHLRPIAFAVGGADLENAKCQRSDS